MYYVLSASIQNGILLRALAAFLTAWLLSDLAAVPFISQFRKRNLGQIIRTDGPEKHLKKEGTPTMGGLFVFAALFCTILLYSDFLSPEIAVIMSAVFLFGGIGFIDDYLKLKLRASDGLSIRGKLILQVIAASAVVYLARIAIGSSHFTLSVFTGGTGKTLDLGIWYYPMAVLFIVFIVNSVNLSDGLDGLAGGLVTISLVFLVGMTIVSIYTGIISVQKSVSHELLVIYISSIGAVMGFLRFNLKPARVFMGDVGSQGLGALIAVSAVIMHIEPVMMLVGAVFVGEALSVIIQVVSFKCFRRRVFRMAPLHHHFELKGHDEKTVVFRFWAAGVISAACGAFLLALTLAA